MQSLRRQQLIGAEVGLRSGLAALAWLGAALVAEPSVARIQDHDAALDARLDQSLRGLPPADADAIEAFYARRDHQALWSSDERLGLPARLREALRDQGLDPAPPPFERGDVAPSEADILALYLAYARALTDGAIDPRALDALVDYAPDAFDPATALERLVELGPEAALDAAAPSHPHYRDLLAYYRKLRREDAPAFVDDGVERALGDGGAEPLRARLVALGDLDPWRLRGDRFDRTVRRAVQRFQSRHNLDRHGRLDAATRAALARPLAETLRAIEVTLERLRWTANDWAERRIVANVPGFEVELIEADRRTRMRSIVGEPEHPTPSFSDEMTYLVFQPYWNVPRSIVVQDFLPQLQKNWRWAPANEMTVFDHSGTRLQPRRVAWPRFGENYLPVRLRQDPGPNNPLGRIKFMFPNRWAIYLHDTPYKRSFAAPTRAFSHGCVRLQDPNAMARALLAHEGWSAEQVDAAMEGSSTRTVRLREPVEVHIVYLTHWIDEDGRLQARRDLYGWEPEVRSALDAKLSAGLLADGVL